MLYRAWLLAFLFSLFGVIAVSRLFWLQILNGEQFASVINQDRLVSELIPARRGRILDRHGAVIVDNRNMYHLSLVLNDFTLPWRQTKRHPFYRLDQDGLTHFIAELSLRLPIDAARIRSVVLDELERNPGVAIRYQRGQQQSTPRILAIPTSTLQLDALTSNEQEKVATLFEQRFLSQDPRRAISSELVAQRQDDIILLSPTQYSKLCHDLDQVVGMGNGFSAEALLPFMPRIEIDLTSIDSTRSPLEWYLFDAERMDQAIRHLSQFINTQPDELRSVLLTSLSNMQLRDDIPNWYFAAASDAEQINLSLPLQTEQHVLSIYGLPPNRERIYIIQGNAAHEDGFLSLMLNRIKTNLNIKVDWMHALFENKSERISAFRSGRIYRKKQVALDYEACTRFIQRITATLSQAGIESSLEQSEKYITNIRRLTDREWQGLSRHKPIPFIHDIPRHIAIGLSGSGLKTPDDIASDYQNAEPLLQGVRISTSNGREYLYPKIASHLIGYLGRIDSSMSRDEALSLGLDPKGLRGRSGIEARYDHILQGSTGVFVKRLDEKTKRYIIDKEQSRDPLPGQDLRLSINIQLQEQCEYALNNWYALAEKLGTTTETMTAGLRSGAGRAGMVVMDVANGEILAMGSSPSYDLSGFNKQYSELIKDPRRPLQDNATIANEHPGSVVKVLLALAGLHEGVVTTKTIIHCPGYMARNSRGQKILRDHAIGDLDIVMAIAKSSNVYFATIGARMGARKVVEWYELFGLGKKFAKDIPWQRPQTLPSPDNVKQLRPREPHWNNYDTWSISIGQFIKIAPIEAITIPACVANGGSIVKPHLVVSKEDFVDVHIPFKQHHLDAVREGMIKAVTVGTVPYLKLGGYAQGIQVAAKTGTSQWGPKGNKLDHAWLIGYAPVENPKICFAIFVHSGSSGGRACAGIAKHVLESYYEIYGKNGHRR